MSPKPHVSQRSDIDLLCDYRDAARALYGPWARNTEDEVSRLYRELSDIDTEIIMRLATLRTKLSANEHDLARLRAIDAAADAAGKGQSK